MTASRKFLPVAAMLVGSTLYFFSAVSSACPPAVQPQPGAPVALNPQPIPPGRMERKALNPHPIPPGMPVRFGSGTASTPQIDPPPIQRLRMAR